MTKKIKQLQTIGSENWRSVDDIEHVLLRPEVYIGSMKPSTKLDYVFENGKIVQKEITTVTGAIVLANELMNNVYDEFVKLANKAKSKKDKHITFMNVKWYPSLKTLVVSDDGGIPVALHEPSGKLLPDLLFGQLKSGGNYNDKERKDVSGLNGLGASLVNVFSKKFTVKTSNNDGYIFEKTWCNNMRESEQKTDDECLLKGLSSGTTIIAQFDFERFPEEAFGDDFVKVLEMRCAEIAAMASMVFQQHNHATLTTKFTVDGEGTTKSFQFANLNEFIELFDGEAIVDRHQNFAISMMLSQGSMESMGIVNSIRCDRGTHIDTFLGHCVWHIRNHIQKHHGIDVKPAKIKSYIKIISTWRIPAPSFSGQTKEELTKPVEDFGYELIPSAKFIGALLRSNIVKAIVSDLNQQIIAAKRAEIQKREKEAAKAIQSNSFSPKHLDAVHAGKPKQWKNCSIFVVEGDSASKGFRRFRKPEFQGVFAMQGKSCGNALKMDEFGTMQNASLSGLMAVLGLNHTKANAYRYSQFIFAQDADVDGHCIAGLLLAFLVRFFPETIEKGMVYKLLTPIVIARKGNDVKRYYDLSEFETDLKKGKLKGWKHEYFKGLAGLPDSEYKLIVNEPKLQKIVMDDETLETVNIWFSKDPHYMALRKQILANTDADELFEYLTEE